MTQNGSKGPTDNQWTKGQQMCSKVHSLKCDHKGYFIITNYWYYV